MTVRAVCWDVSLHVMDGGGRRVRAFLDVLSSLSLEYETVGVGPKYLSGGADTQPSVLRRVKRRALPSPMRSKVERELALARQVVNCGLSLAPVANRWTLENSERSWLDFPDLMSDFSRNSNGDSTFHRCAFSPFNHAQSVVWSRREAAESRQAEVVTTASWRDSRMLSQGTVWLPTPTHSRQDRSRSERRLRSGVLRYGFLANFSYPPNRHAFNTLVKDWQPFFESEGGEVVVGGYGSGELPVTPGIVNIGEVASVHDFYDDIDVALAPITMGGGMKVKVVEAMSHGLPVVVTEHSRTGLPPGIYAECNVFGSETIGAFRDPRLDSKVLSELEMFEKEIFARKVSELWRANMQM